MEWLVTFCCLILYGLYIVVSSFGVQKIGVLILDVLQAKTTKKIVLRLTCPECKMVALQPIKVIVKATEILKSLKILFNWKLMCVFVCPCRGANNLKSVVRRRSQDCTSHFSSIFQGQNYIDWTRLILMPVWQGVVRGSSTESTISWKFGL